MAQPYSYQNNWMSGALGDPGQAPGSGTPCCDCDYCHKFHGSQMKLEPTGELLSWKRFSLLSFVTPFLSIRGPNSMDTSESQMQCKNRHPVQAVECQVSISFPELLRNTLFRSLGS